MLSKDVTNLLGIIEAIEKIETYCAPFSSFDSFFKNQLHFDAVLMNFVIIGEMVERLSESLKAEYCSVDWAKVKSFRNIIAHDYFGVDAEEVWQIIQTNIPTFKSAVNKLLDENS